MPAAEPLEGLADGSRRAQESLRSVTSGKGDGGGSGRTVVADRRTAEDRANWPLYVLRSSFLPQRIDRADVLLADQQRVAGAVRDGARLVWLFHAVIRVPEGDWNIGPGWSRESRRAGRPLSERRCSGRRCRRGCHVGTVAGGIIAQPAWPVRAGRVKPLGTSLSVPAVIDAEADIRSRAGTGRSRSRCCAAWGREPALPRFGWS